MRIFLLATGFHRTSAGVYTCAVHFACRSVRRNRNITRYFKFSKCSKQPRSLLDSKLCLDDLSSEKGNRMPDPQNIHRYLQGNAKHEAATLYAKDIQNGKEVSRWHEHAACLAENPVPKRKFAIQPRAGALPAAYTPSPCRATWSRQQGCHDRLRKKLQEETGKWETELSLKDMATAY